MEKINTQGTVGSEIELRHANAADMMRPRVEPWVTDGTTANLLFSAINCTERQKPFQTGKGASGWLYIWAENGIICVSAPWFLHHFLSLTGIKPMESSRELAYHD